MSMSSNKLNVPFPEGTLTLWLPEDCSGSEDYCQKVQEECSSAYFAWADTDETNTPILSLPQYIVMCLNDEGLGVVQWDFEKNQEKESNGTYLCDGLSQNCLGIIPIAEVNWFTSCLGFCTHCNGRLHRHPQKILEFCYDECESGNEEIANFVVSLTK